MIDDIVSHRSQGRKINDAACKIARDVANEGDAMVAGGVCQTPTYLTTQDEGKVREEFRKQMEVFVDNQVDFMIAEVSCTKIVKITVPRLNLTDIQC